MNDTYESNDEEDVSDSESDYTPDVSLASDDSDSADDSDGAGDDIDDSIERVIRRVCGNDNEFIGKSGVIWNTNPIGIGQPGER